MKVREIRKQEAEWNEVTSYRALPLAKPRLIAKPIHQPGRSPIMR